MKLCMIGIRGHNGYVLDGLGELPHVKVVGLSAGTGEDDVVELKSWCNEHGHAPELFADYRKMLDEIKPDMVSVCGPLELHAQMCVQAFQRGIHVFCEKPVAITLEDFKRLKMAYGEAKVHFAAMMGLRYHPAFYTAWRAVWDGAIGVVRLINMRKSYKLGRREPYYRRRETYGGTIPWVGSHAIDCIHWFSSESFCLVYATHTVMHNRDHEELEMSALCHFTLTNDVFASASIDYLRPANAPTHGDDRIRVAGTDGVIEVRGGEVYLINGETDGEEQLPAECDRQIFCDFVEHVEGKTISLIGPEETLAVTEACLLARRSADEGRVVRILHEKNTG